MSPSRIVPDEARYVVTPEGRAAASAEETCECRLVVSLGMLICCYCGYGSQLVRPQAAHAPAKERTWK